MSTVGTPLRRRVPLVNLDEHPPIPCCFLLQLSDELAPAHITNGLCQAVILDHIHNLKTLDADGLVFTNQPRRELMLIVPSSVYNLGMDTGNLESCLGPVLASLLLRSQAFLSLGKFLLNLAEVLGIADLLPCREKV
jgi:hypothetical protein